MWRPAVSGMEEARIRARSKNRRIRRYFVCRLKRSEARDFSHVRFTFWKLLVIFLERTIIAIPLIVLFANMIGL